MDENTELVILSSDDKYYRLVWYGYTGTKYVSAWIKDYNVATKWLKTSNYSIPTTIEETRNVSSLGGNTVDSMQKRLSDINERLLTVKPESIELKENLLYQINRITADIAILESHPELKVTSILDFLQIHKICDTGSENLH